MVDNIALTVYSFIELSPNIYNYKEDKNKQNCFFPKDYFKMLFWKEDEFPDDFIFRFSLSFWEIINKKWIISSSDLYIFLFSMSDNFTKNYKTIEIKSCIFSILEVIRFNSITYLESIDPEYSEKEFKKGTYDSIDLMDATNMSIYFQDINILLMTKPTIVELCKPNLLKSDYLLLILKSDLSIYFIHQLIYDIIHNSRNIFSCRLNGFINNLIENTY